MAVLYITEYAFETPDSLWGLKGFQKQGRGVIIIGAIASVLLEDSEISSMMAIIGQ